MTLPTINELRQMSDRDLLAHAEAVGTDEAAWDELAERNAERAAGWCERSREPLQSERLSLTGYGEV